MTYQPDGPTGPGHFYKFEYNGYKYTQDALDWREQAVSEEYPKSFAQKFDGFWFIITKPSEDGINTYYDRIDVSKAETRELAWVKAYDHLFK